MHHHGGEEDGGKQRHRHKLQPDPELAVGHLRNLGLGRVDEGVEREHALHFAEPHTEKARSCEQRRQLHHSVPNCLYLYPIESSPGKPHTLKVCRELDSLALLIPYPRKWGVHSSPHWGLIHLSLYPTRHNGTQYSNSRQRVSTLLIARVLQEAKSVLPTPADMGRLLPYYRTEAVHTLQLWLD